MKSAKLSLKDNLKRIIASILVTLMIFVQVPWNAIAANADDINNADKNNEIVVDLNKENEDEKNENEETNTEDDKKDNNETKDKENNKTEDSKTEDTNKKDNNNEEETNQTENEQQENQLNNEPQNQQQPTLRNAPLRAPQVNEENQFKVNLRWGGTSNTTYSWNAEQQENRVIKLTFYYQNEVTPRAYEPGELVVTIPGIGKLNRASIKKASDVAADVYGTTEPRRDWSYTYDARTDTYTFYNNKAIEEGASFNGSFEMLYEFKARESVNDYIQILHATLTDGEQTATSQDLRLEYTSKRDIFYINKTARAITSIDGLSRYVAEGKTARDYAWVRYTFRYNTQELNARGLKSRYLIDTLPQGCVIASSTNVVNNEDGTVSYRVNESSVPENSVREYSIIVGYPEEYVGQTIDNTAYIYGKYYEENEDTLLAQSTVEVLLEKVPDVYTIGIVPGKNMSPDYVYNDTLDQNINFSASLYGTTVASAFNDQEYTLAITDDLLEIIAQDDQDATKTKYYTLQDNEYKFTSITVPGKNSFNNSNGYAISDGNYTVKLYALYAENVNTRALSEYTLVDERAWETNSYTKELEGNVVAIRAEISGLKESIKSFYISTRGTINIAESSYVDPTYIINYDFTEYLDSNGNSLLPALSRENYSQERIYDRDISVYGQGVRRSNDTIRIIERVIQPNPGTYSATADMTPFEVDENAEYFLSTLTHKINVNNREAKEINNIEVHGVVGQNELETLEETIALQYSGLKFKTPVSSDTDMQDYLMQRATITKEGNEISINFDFSDNPITSSSFSLGYTVESRLDYEDYYDNTNPSYSIRTYAYTNESTLRPQSTASHNNKTMATDNDNESILLALASHQELIKMVKTMYTEDFVQEDAVTPIDTVYTYRLKLRNGYNTLVSTEFIDILEHAELTEVDGDYPYESSEWYGTFKNIDVTYMESKGLTTKAYYANTLTPTYTDWTLMESYEDGIWTTTNPVKAIKVEIEGEISENSIAYIDVNMTAPNDESLVDKFARNTYTINCKAVDLYTGVFSTYMDNLPSNEVDVRLTKKEYNVTISKTDATSGAKLAGVQFGIYDSQGNKIRTSLTGILGNTVVKNLKEGTYTIKEEITPDGYKTIQDYTLTISNGSYTLKCGSTTKAQGQATIGDSIPEISFNIENERAKGSITVHKIDEYKDENQQEIPLANVQFDLLNQAGTVIGTQTTNAQGNAVFNNLDWGANYTIQERTALQGYEIAENINTYLSRQEKDKTVVVENKRKTGSVELTKQDEVDGTLLEGATYALFAEEDIYDKDGNVLYAKDTLIKEANTDENGKATFTDLIWGDYYLKETQTVYGYDLSEEKHLFTINAQSVDTLIEKTENEKRSKANLQLVKIDDKGAMLQGVEFGLYNAADDSAALRKEVTMSNELLFTQVGDFGWKQTVDGTWKSDNYNIHSSTAEIESNEFTLLQPETLSFDWSVSSQGTSYDYLYYTIINTQNNTTVSGTGNTSASKIGGTSYGSTEESLSYNTVQKELQPGTYKLKFSYTKNSSTNRGLDAGFVKNININCEEYPIESYIPITGTTNEVGQLNIEGIEWGNYYLKETKTIDGYEKIDTKFDFAVDRETFQNNNTTVTQVLNEDTNENVSIIRNTKKLGHVILTKYAAEPDGTETDTVLPDAEYELYQSNGTLIDTYTTNNQGKIEVDNLDWNSYYFLEKNAPSGYSTSDKKLSFVINSKNVSFLQELSAYDKPESGEITINKTIKAADLYNPHGNATFVFKIVGKDTEENEKLTLYRTVTFSSEDINNADINGNITKTIKITDIDPYKYEITEEENYRYELDEIIPVTSNAEVNNQTGIINLSGVNNKGEITFANNKENNSFLTDSVIITNTMQSEFYLIGIGAVPKEDSYVIGSTLTSDDFTITLYYSGGQEVVLQTTQGVTINGQDSFTKTETGDYIVNVEYTTNGKTFETEVPTTWVMPSDYFKYTTNTDGTINIIGINSNYASPEVLYIPAEVNGKRVKRVGGNIHSTSNKLLNIDNVKSVVISEGVTSIGDFAFYNCSGLTSIDIPEGVTSIGNSVFYGCSGLTSIDIPVGVTKIGSGAFYNCSSLTSIEIPEGVTRIEANTFYGCSNLTEIIIPEGVTYLGSYVFSNCSGLTSIEIPDSVTTIENHAFNECSSLTSIEIPEGVTSIRQNTFYGCSGLTSVTIPDSVTSIEKYAFYNCRSLTSIEIPANVTSIGERAFYKCSSLTSIEIPEGVTSIGEYTFFNCSSLTGSVSIPEGITSIGPYAFLGCRSLTSIEIPASVTSIGNSAFNGCSGLTSIEIPASVTSIGSYAFSGCSGLTGNITIPEGVTSIRQSTFYGCSGLTGIEILASVTSIGDSAFNGCSGLTSIEIPASVASIGSSAFSGCSGLTGNITIPEGVTSIGDNAFNRCTGLTSIEIPEGVTSIRSTTFWGCIGLTNIEIPDGVTSIGSNAFYNCSGLTEITIPSSVTSIGSSTFGNCRSLTSIEIPEGVTSIGSSVFSGCSGLTNIEIPSSVTSIGNYAFDGCISLATVYYRGTPEQFEAINIGTNNNPFRNANKEYNYTGE